MFNTVARGAVAMAGRQRSSDAVERLEYDSLRGDFGQEISTDRQRRTWNLRARGESIECVVCRDGGELRKCPQHSASLSVKLLCVFQQKTSIM